MGSGRTSQDGRVDEPLVPVLFAAAGGVLLDRYLGVPAAGWLGFAAAAMVGWWWLRRKHRWPAALALLGSILCLFASWHHCWWNAYPALDLGRFATPHPKPVYLRVTALTPPATRRARDGFRPAAQQWETQLEVHAHAVRQWEGQQAQWHPVRGKSLLRIRGDASHLRAGDELELAALLWQPSRPRNPGEYDFGRRLRNRRIRSVLQAEFPAAVLVHGRRPAPLANTFHAARQAGLDAFHRHVGAEQGPLAAALLLGVRDNVPLERRHRFLMTGTMHLLAISGLHVGILVGGLWYVGRLGVPRRIMLALVMAFVMYYTLLTDARPPVVRAATLVCVVCIARLTGRRAFSRNTLSAAALLLLLWNPTQLFQIGAQLSFLAVAVLAYWRHPTNWIPEDPLDRLIYWSRSWPVRALRRVRFQCWELVRATTLIWLYSAPLITCSFHVVTPVGLLLNPLLSLPITGALLSGFGVLLCGNWMPWGASMCGFACRHCLSTTEKLIGWGYELPGGHGWIPPMPTSWLIGFYSTSVTMLMLTRRTDRPVFHRVLLSCWLVLAIVWYGLSPTTARTPNLAATFIAVGHGTSVYLRTPGGEAWLYDAGGLGRPDRAAQLIAGTLWADGVRRLDGVVLSHADADHYNALSTLLQQFPIRAVYVSPHMFSDDSPSLQQLKRELAAAKVPVVEIVRGHTWKLNDGTVMRALHPSNLSTMPAGQRTNDNAHSIVLEVASKKRRLLLPGDLEGDGLEHMLARPAVDCDVLMAPHHGSPFSQPAAVAAWCRPEYVVISGGNVGYSRTTEEIYRQHGAQVHHTALHGAIRVVLARTQVEVRQWQMDPW